jgi:thiol-disulfide isomerase/thioredoxin
MSIRWAVTGAVAASVLAGAATMLVIGNPAPDVPLIPAAEASASSRPYVIKLHARWCPVCMTTKDAWADVQDAYTGRVNLVVFDFTTTTTTEASRASARTLGLEHVFDEHAGETGTVLVVDGSSKNVRAVLHGRRDPEEYRAAIDAALKVAAVHR